MSGDEGDFWNDMKPVMKEASQKKRASNREKRRPNLGF